MVKIPEATFTTSLNPVWKVNPFLTATAVMSRLGLT